MTVDNPNKELVNIYFNPLFRYNWYTTIIRYMLQPLNIMDLVAITPFYVGLFVKSVESAAIIRVFRVARTIRFIRSRGNFQRSLMVLDRTIVEAAPMIMFLVYVTAVGLVICGALIYYAEQGTFTVTTEYPNGAYLRPTLLGDARERSPFESVLVGMYWSVITSSTVGYGDLYPTTTWGRFFAGACALFGVMVIALPVTVLTAHFHKAYNEIYLQSAAGVSGTAAAVPPLVYDIASINEQDGHHHAPCHPAMTGTTAGGMPQIAVEDGVKVAGQRRLHTTPPSSLSHSKAAAADSTPLPLPLPLPPYVRSSTSGPRNSNNTASASASAYMNNGTSTGIYVAKTASPVLDGTAHRHHHYPSSSLPNGDAKTSDTSGARMMRSSSRQANGHFHVDGGKVGNGIAVGQSSYDDTSMAAIRDVPLDGEGDGDADNNGRYIRHNRSSATIGRSTKAAIIGTSAAPSVDMTASHATAAVDHSDNNVHDDDVDGNINDGADEDDDAVLLREVRRLQGEVARLLRALEQARGSSTSSSSRSSRRRRVRVKGRRSSDDEGGTAKSHSTSASSDSSTTYTIGTNSRRRRRGEALTERLSVAGAQEENGSSSDSNNDSKSVSSISGSGTINGDAHK